MLDLSKIAQLVALRAALETKEPHKPRSVTAAALAKAVARKRVAAKSMLLAERYGSGSVELLHQTFAQPSAKELQRQADALGLDLTFTQHMPDEIVVEYRADRLAAIGVDADNIAISDLAKLPYLTPTITINEINGKKKD